MSSRRVAPTPRQRPPCVRWAVSRPGRQLSRRTRWNLDPPRCRAVEAPPPANSNQVIGEPCRQSPRGPPFTLGLGSFQLFWRRVLRGTACTQRGCRCAYPGGYVPWELRETADCRITRSPQPKGARDPVTHARRGVVNPASLVCGWARGDE